MSKSEITLQILSYNDLREFKYRQFDDPYGIIAFMTDHLRDTLLACPNNDDDSKTAMYIVTDGNIAVGRALQFGTKLKVNDEIISVQTGGSLYVVDKYRPLGIGADMLMTAKLSKEYDIKINSLFSAMVVPMFEKMKYTFYDIPQYVFVNDTTPFLESKGIKGVFLSISRPIANIPICLRKGINYIRKKSLLKRFVVSQEFIVPKWAEDMALNDNHKYMELHNREWLQWNLDYNYNGFSGDKQSFFAVYDKSGEPKGFFMTKERYEENAGSYHNIIRSTIVEWATVDNKLNEADINLLALSTFSQNTFLIHTVTTDPVTAKRLKKMGFIRHGMLQMNLFDRKNRFGDIANINLWRIRYGCCNTIIFGEGKKIYN